MLLTAVDRTCGGHVTHRETLRAGAQGHVLHVHVAYWCFNMWVNTCG